MATRSREQWVRAVRRWSVVGAVVGLVAGVAVTIVDSSPYGVLDVLGFLLSFALMGAAMGLVLWGSAYRYEIWSVWGRTATLLTMGLIVLLGGAGVGVGCALGACGER